MNKLKTLIKYILFLIIDFLAKNNSKIEKNNLLFIRLDAIGDYVMFRNFIKILKESKKYKDYKITLVGNIAWKSLAEELDNEYVDNFVWIDRKKLEKNLVYRYKKLKEISSKGYDIIINPTYSRCFFADDSIVKVVNASEKIGSIGDLSNIRKWQKNISDNYYTKLLPVKDEIMFEFYRNKEFFENLFGKKIDIKKPFIRLKPKKLDFELPNKYAILFIGASVSFRKWDIRNFVELGKHLKNEYGYEIVLCGGPDDLKDIGVFSQLSDYKYIDLVGKTSLIDFMHVIYNGNLMISNETSAPHFAIALEMTNVFVIYNGNHFGRFTPYPKEVAPNYYPIYHPEIEKDLGNYEKLSNSYGYGSRLNINEISVANIVDTLNSVLK